MGPRSGAAIRGWEVGLVIGSRMWGCDAGHKEVRKGFEAGMWGRNVLHKVVGLGCGAGM